MEEFLPGNPCDDRARWVGNAMEREREREEKFASRDQRLLTSSSGIESLILLLEEEAFANSLPAAIIRALNNEVAENPATSNWDPKTRLYFIFAVLTKSHNSLRNIEIAEGKDHVCKFTCWNNGSNAAVERPFLRMLFSYLQKQRVKSLISFEFVVRLGESAGLDYSSR